MNTKEFEHMIKAKVPFHQLIKHVPQVKCGLRTFFQSFPDFMPHFPKDSVSAAQWAQTIGKEPGLVKYADFSTFTAEAWVLLCRKNARYISYCKDLSVLTAEHWESVIRKQPSITSYPPAYEAMLKVGMKVERDDDRILIPFDPETHKIPKTIAKTVPKPAKKSPEYMPPTIVSIKHEEPLFHAARAMPAVKAPTVIVKKRRMVSL